MKPEIKAIIDRIAASPTLSATETDALMKEAFAMASSLEDRREAGDYLRKAISRRKRPDIDVKVIMGEASEFLNLSYIAKRFFNKDRTWLYQRLNRSIVNGKPAAFSETELKIFSDALHKMGVVIQQTSINLSH
ncbi:DUF5053 domain-containing protein [uncultured Muribaculum sp.]|uniref:DUF5053 domain-containing protein n=1 Tax=uncultured Muribaculum sp. TaxID=1918613 RepID=UPI0025FDF6ED|nr:DUF5053 domain-containing protein [uncultured Muribaculum sp.]